MPRKLACVIGWPVTQSVSPAIHNAAFAHLGLDWSYVALSVRPGAAADGVELLRTLEMDGANVTVPHKAAVIPHLDGIEGDARAFGAVNTIVRRGRELVGHNTDGDGFLRALDETGWQGSDALVVGAGGAARAVVAVLVRRLGSDRVTVSARRSHQAGALAEAFGCRTAAWGDPTPASLLVNATSARAGLPLDALFAHDRQQVVDLIYPFPPTELVAAASHRGIPAQDGLPMLVHQAALAFELWTAMAAPVEVMRQAADRARAGG